MSVLETLPIKIFADGADLAAIRQLDALPLVRGLTTNPTLMRAAGVADYEAFAREVLAVVTAKPVCFEVLSDDFAEMGRQARKIASWAPNIFVKVPITNSHGESALPLVRELAAAGVQLNVTALLSERQVAGVAEALHPDVPAMVSVFAGRIADTGRDPLPVMRRGLELLRPLPRAELLWASVREILNLYQAAAAGVPIVTVPPAILTKAAALGGRDLEALSLDTVRMFAGDARAAGYQL